MDKLKLKTFLKQFHWQDWSSFIQTEIDKSYFISLFQKVIYGYENNSLFPKERDLFRALELCSVDNLKVIIIGQDPYFHKGQANGLAFSVNNDVKIPPSLRNIFKKLFLEYKTTRTNLDLSDWAHQGVLLLNTIMTVQHDQPLSCADWGWKNFTFNLVKYVLSVKKGVVIVCLGKYASSFVNKITDNNNDHFFLHTSHPSPLSAHHGFWENSLFKAINQYLKQQNKKEIKWN